MGKKSRKKEEKSPVPAGTPNRWPDTDTWVLIALGGIFCLALFLRLRFVSIADKIPFNVLSDSSQYFSWAKKILSGEGVAGVYHQSPLYPFFLAFLFKGLGTSIRAALIVQSVMGAISCILVFYLGKKVFSDRWVGLLSAFGLAIYRPALFYNGMLLMATLVIFLNLLFLLVLLKAFEFKNIWLWAGAGAILGLSVLGRANILLFLPFLLILLTGWAFYDCRGSCAADKPRTPNLILLRALYPFILFTIAILLTIAPVTLRNYIKGKDFVLTAANAGITFFEGNNVKANGQYMDPPGLDLGDDFNGKKIAEYIEGGPLRPSEISAFWFGEAIRFIKAEPLAYLKLIIKKILYFWNKYEIPNAENIYFARQYSSILTLPLLTFLIVGALGLLGMIISISEGNRRAIILILFLLSHMIGTILFFVTARYRLPITPILITFMAYAILAFVAWIREGRFDRVMLWVFVCVCCFLFVSIPWKGLNPKLDYASSYDNIGILFYLTGDYERAIRYYKLAIDYDPNYVKPYNNLGGIYYVSGKNDEAMQYWNRGLELEPNSPMIHMNLITMYLKNGNIALARKAFKVAAPQLPYSIRMKELRERLFPAE